MTRLENYALPTEDQEQTKLATWLTKSNIPFYAIPNGGKRDMLEAVKFKRTGVQAGVPDICVCKASGSYHGLYIELKRKKHGKVSENQLYWLALLREHGYYAEVAHGFEEAREMVLHYLSLNQVAK